MAISFPLSIPATPGFLSINWKPVSAVAVQRSPFTFAEKVYAFQGQQRMVSVNLPTMTITQAKEWQSWAYSLNGLEGTFYLTDSIGDVLTGAATATGLIKGASQLGQDLITDQWTINITDLFKAGDWISLNNRLFTILADVNSDGAGEATLSLWPKIRIAYADNLEVKYGINARGIFRLNEWPEMGWDVNRLMSGFAFSAKEVVQ